MRKLLAMALLLLAWPAAVQAAVPSSVPAQGSLLTLAGTPVADGDYVLTLQLYGQDKGGTAVWKEGPLVVTVKYGQFALDLGSTTPLTPALLASLPEAWLGVTVGNDPELQRKRLSSVVYALRAGQAEGVDCSGCIGAAQLDPKLLASLAKTADLVPLAKSSDLAQFAKATDLGDYVKAAALAKVAATGSYQDLTDAPKLADVATTGQFADLQGVPTLVKAGSSCGTGLVVKGIKADGSLDCVAGGV
ncbi:MAG: hypothetical protein HY902_16515 [Deltaproteobacteria bacterium]|nr:hypothetical protein [Deltaproteobacteria bacterium]